MVVAFGWCQHPGLGRLAVDLQAKLASSAAVGSNDLLLRVGIDDPKHFGLALLGEQLAIGVPRREIVGEALDFGGNELDQPRALGLTQVLARLGLRAGLAD